MKRAARNHSARGAIVPKNSCTRFIHCFPEVYVSNGDVQLDDAVPVATGGLENCVHVVKRLLGSKLARDEDQAIVDSSLRVMSGGLRRVRSVNSLDFHAA